MSENAIEAEQGGYWLGFDLGGTKMMAVLFDGEFKVVGRRRKKTKGHHGSKAVIDRMLETIQELLAEHGLTMSQLLGIGLGVPGPVDQDRGIVLEAANLGWRKTKIAETMERALGCRATVLNDVDAGIFGEYRFGAGRGGHTVLGVFPGTGIGGGCVYNGEVLHGHGKSCLEIGHIQINVNGRQCGCGLIGCLETEASRLAIAADAAMAAHRGEAPNLLKEVGTELSDVRSSVLAKAIESGDVAVERIIRRAASQIGAAVATVVHLLAPDVVVLGGGLVEALPELFVVGVKDSANRHVMPSYRDTFKVVAAKLGDDATAIGAAAWTARKTARELAPAGPR